MTTVNPAVLTWARETAGLDLAAAALALGFNGKRQSGEEKLSAIERGEEVLTRPQLLRMARLYRRPLVAFYLAKPPATAPRGEDFRTLTADKVKESAAAVEMLVRDVHVRQQLVRSALEDAEEAVPHQYVGSVNLKTGVSGVVDRVRDALGFNLNEFRNQKTVEEAFNYLRRAVERTGVFVLLIGNLGSHHSNISPEVFRGFALADAVAPFVVINDQDAKTAWSFTLLHELVHIWLGQTGISGGYFGTKLEQFCNDVASELLLPSSELTGFEPVVEDLDKLIDQISAFSRDRKLSRALVAYRLLLRGKIDEPTWHRTSEKLRELWLREREKARGQGKGGPSYYVVRRHRVGGALLDFVKRSLNEGVLTPTKAGRVLGVRATNLEPLLESA